MTPIEIVAVIFGFLCVYFTIKENIWCWPTGLVQVFLYIFIFYKAKLYSDTILHVIYVFMQFYGWYYWLHGGKEHKEALVTKLTQAWIVATLAIASFGTIGWGYFMASKTDAAMPYGDAFTTVASLVAQWLMSRKKLESWYYWIAVDIIAIGIYYAKGLYLTSGLYVCFLFMATAGLIRWKKSFSEPQLKLAEVKVKA